MDDIKTRCCWFDEVAPRAIPDGHTNDNSMSVTKCVFKAENGGWRYAGVYYGTECWYGDTLSSSPASNGCDTPCGGTPSELCGSSSRLNVYEDPKWVDINPSRADILPFIKEIAELVSELSQTLQQRLDALKEYRESVHQRRTRLTKRLEVAKPQRERLNAVMKSWLGKEPRGTRQVDAAARRGAINTHELGEYIPLVEVGYEVISEARCSVESMPELTTLSSVVSQWR